MAQAVQADRNRCSFAILPKEILGSTVISTAVSLSFGAALYLLADKQSLFSCILLGNRGQFYLTALLKVQDLSIVGGLRGYRNNQQLLERDKIINNLLGHGLIYATAQFASAYFNQ